MTEEIAISVVAPVYNEKDSLVRLRDEVITALEPLNRPFEVIFVNDGSHDGSEQVLDDLARDPRIKVIHFRRNFGQSAALMAGFDHASGRVVVSLDADL
ncbi:MAG: glycosyltransferase, partial [Thermodesulfobacteriota bacterium]